jgi:hypothetical protein
MMATAAMQPVELVLVPSPQQHIEQVFTETRCFALLMLLLA